MQTRFDNGLEYETFLRNHGSDSDRQRWQHVYDAVRLADSQLELLRSFSREMKVLCMAGAWCGDCVSQCPIFTHFEHASSQIKVRYLDRDVDQELARELNLCGSPRVPQVVFLSEDGMPVGRYGERTLTKYREMASQLTGAACATGIVNAEDPTFLGVIQDWLNEFERIQLILRLSPRLRQRHGD